MPNRDGISPSEADVSANLTKLIESADGRVAITSFSSNVGRIKSISRAAEAAGRSVMLLGRSMKRMCEVAGELGYLDGLPPFVSEEDFASIPRKNLVIILTGSQGESRAALAKIANEEMRGIELNAGDTVVFSSRAIPGNEKPINDIKNKLIDRGIAIITDADQLVHVSGHPRREELKQMYNWGSPESAGAGARRTGASRRPRLARHVARHPRGRTGSQWRHAAPRARQGGNHR